ncbi:hydrophobic surface binding protein A family protein [Metarhizium robertsii]|uniref:Cell wall galactomannoprotein n=3 Tax=Metarhizium TaxID=5529 RepID=E9F908_METRA|nr:Cell wall galactomannoprotein [Metarhizium robertsii ARSEF 23]AAB69311.1 4MeS [Metarhizium anisopliae]EFY95776.1 Cell wall galactomannoprotein [Metarhizium robertsii ARSEF 23]EXU96918.1 hydrophobic surface binding protein A family protein [Metarhizium robertsii]
MLSIKNLLFLAVAATGSVIKRDAAQVKQDLQTINADTQAVLNAVNSYNGGLANALPIVTAQQQLSKDLKTGTTNANNAGPVSDADADEILAYVKDTLFPSTENTLAALEGKKATFANDGLTSTVKSSLESLKKDTGDLSDALKNGAPADKQPEAEGLKNQIAARFDSAIAQFS